MRAHGILKGSGAAANDSGAMCADFSGANGIVKPPTFTSLKLHENSAKSITLFGQPEGNGDVAGWQEAAQTNQTNL